MRALVGWLKLNSRLAFGIEWTLCIAASLLATLTVWPTCTPRTCGMYWQPFWSSITVAAGTA